LKILNVLRLEKEYEQSRRSTCWPLQLPISRIKTGWLSSLLSRLVLELHAHPETLPKDSENAPALSLIMRSEKLIAKLLFIERSNSAQGKAMGTCPHSFAALVAGAMLFSGEDKSHLI